MNGGQARFPGSAGLEGDSLALFRECEGALAANHAPLPDQPAETAAATLAALWHAAAGDPMSAQRAVRTRLPALDAAGAARLRELLSRRLEGVPLAHLTGRQRFMGIELIAGPGALIPREETELVGRLALEALTGIAERAGEARVVDVCTGSGNLALALAWHEPRARVWGADICGNALGLAKRNAEHIGLADRVSFLWGDLLAPFDSDDFRGRIDLLVCNPPYISSGRLDDMPHEIRGHEPRHAFDGGPLGIRFLVRLLDEAPAVLRPGGTLVFEVGLGQGDGVRRRIEKRARYRDIVEARDANGQVRALAMRLADGSGARAS